MKTSISFLKINYDFNTFIDLVNSSQADFIHVDVTDGLFVSSKTKFTKEMIECLKSSKKPKDIHLMTLHLKDYIDLFLKTNPEFITFHYEATPNIKEHIDYIKSKGVKVGLALNPTTSIDAIKPFLIDLDLVLIMSVTPGYGGQKFILDSAQKVKELDEIRKKYNAKYLISIDGGINDETSKLVSKEGIDILVAGSFVCTSPNFDEKIRLLKK